LDLGSARDPGPWGPSQIGPPDLGFVDFSHVAKAVVGVNTNFFERLGILGEDILSALNKK